MFENRLLIYVACFIPLVFAGCAIETQRAEWSAPEKQKAKSESEAPVSKEPRLGKDEEPEVVKAPKEAPIEKVSQPGQVVDTCSSLLSDLPGKFDAEKLNVACNEVRTVDDCYSHEGREIFHYQKTGSARGRRILVFGGVHGDEQPGASVARQWMVRLTDIAPRNTWRIIPVLNPDGTVRGTRTNSRKVDINRNFPSKDWTKSALNYWKARVGSNPRKYPGSSPASELETQCAVKHIQTFEPDLIIAIHTPLGVLDFDGPHVDFPKADLPWIRLGHFPGSLGRYMWRDHKVPVLTVELRGNAVGRFEQFDRLQDISGTVALKAQRALGSRN